MAGERHDQTNGALPSAPREPGDAARRAAPAPRPFAIAVSGAAVFALCTVGSAIAVQWVTDHVIVPRFDEGQVAVGTVLIGVGLIIGIGLLRAAGVVVQRTWAGKTQWQVAGSLSEGVVNRLVRQPMSWHARRPDGDLVAAPASTPTPRSPCWRPSRSPPARCC